MCLLHIKRAPIISLFLLRIQPENMEGLRSKGCTTAETTHTHPLRSVQLLPIVPFNRVFALVYLCALLALFYHHLQRLLSSITLVSFFINLILFISDLVLAFMWSTAQAARLYPIQREEFPENLDKVVKRSDYPAVDVFICTADPTKEPPMSVVNTALSVMGYDYLTEKLSVYVSDDGGSALTLFAFMEAAKFAEHWLPFCRRNNVMRRSPESYFESNYSSSSETVEIKMMYESMKARVEHVMEKGAIEDEYITSDEEHKIFNQWTHKFTIQNHPNVIQILIANNKNKDVSGHFMPNLIYISREKSTSEHHRFKAGALNVLLRVSAVMTNASVILTLDCDMQSNDPHTLKRVLCYYLDPEIYAKYSYIQFPQHFQGINKNDIYACQFKRAFEIQPMGFDGLGGVDYFGTNCFFSRRAFFGGPSNFVCPEIPGLSPSHEVDKPIQSSEVLALAHHVADCNYEKQTTWGFKMGFRYGSLVEDLFTGYQMHCEGWRSIFCNPNRPSFLGHAPISLVDLLNQQKRWVIGVFEVGFSKYSPLIYGIKHMGLLMSLLYSQYVFWPIWSIPISTYAFLPQLALINQVRIFPKVSEPWFLLYPFLFLGAYGQDYFDFVSAKGTFQMWWNDQRIWTIRGLTCFLFGSFEFLLKSFGISTLGFSLTSKVVDDEQSKRYEQGIFDFGVSSPMFVTLTMAAMINLVALILGLGQFLKGSDSLEGLVIQMFIAGFGVVNCWPIYGAMVFRIDKGKLPVKITLTAAFLTWALYIVASFIFSN
ncbi:cellulose synthase-like protein G3 [Manihot esculenta]|uniref:UDP-glucose 4-epimerase n=2 Tax=Manihot esculenta TaxID=3983 RepID=A0A2C9WBC0_MANES|nr:cellulose synthase-like protein G3 [Manihot esculenta]OAY56352.2 hypothetical protein MANES_02G007300v8 [Manihot esculenta]